MASREIEGYNHIVDFGLLYQKHKSAYIYLIYSKSCQIIYVGQTNDRSGPMARFCTHMGSNGTFRHRLEDEGFFFEDLNDLKIMCFELPKIKEFTSNEKIFREGVEYLIQRELRISSLTISPPLRPISWVRTNDTVRQPFIRKEATKIILSFQQGYNT